jgi:hypothetical protein
MPAFVRNTTYLMPVLLVLIRGVHKETECWKRPFYWQVTFENHRKGHIQCLHQFMPPSPCSTPLAEAYVDAPWL